MNSVLIVGGGIAGLSAAIALRAAGVENVEVAEINPEWTVYGVGIVQQPNAVWALGQLGMADDVLRTGAPVLGRRIHDHHGTVLEELDAPRLRDGGLAPACGIGRLELHKILQAGVRGAGATVSLGVSVTEFDDDGESVDVTFTDGRRERFDLVIGADGIRSHVRKMLFGDAIKPIYTGQVCWRVNMPRIPELDRTWSFTGGHGKPGFVPISSTEMYLYFLENADESETRVPDDQLADTFRDHLSSYGGVLAEMRDQHITDEATIIHRPVEEVPVLDQWHRGRVVLIGDAVHATSPDVGQGSAMAYEDVLVLVESLQDTSASVDEQLQTFFDRRYPRAKLMCQLSRDVQQINIAGGPQAEMLRLVRQVNVQMAVAP